MSTSAVIVALPRPLDPIRLVGDEEKHATLLYFGETGSLPSDAKQTIIETLQNISRMFTPFGESVIEIARLGSDNPPALVAMLTNNALGRIRESLLINPAIGSYLSNTDQHPGYTPHVTLGYPDFQGEAELRKLASDLIRVRFDRLSLWWNDERIDFSLEDPMNDMMQSVTLAEAEDHLAHFGVKGMKWGVRKDHFGLGAIDTYTMKQRGVAVSRHKNEAQGIASLKTHSKDTYAVLNSIQKHLASPAASRSFGAKMEAHKPELKAIAQKTGKFDRDLYRAQASKAMSEIIKDHLASKKITGVEVKTIPLGPDQFQYIVGDKKTVNAALGDIGMKKFAHADIGQGAVKFTVTLLWNADGTPNGYSVSSSEIAHSDDLVEDFLAHFGVKGMKWGVRRNRDSGSVPKGVAKVAETHLRDPAVAAAIKRNADRAKAVASNKKVKAVATATRVAMTSPEVRKEAVQAGKVAFTIGKYGITPLAAATGIGIPAIAGLGISVKVLSDPAVQAAVSSAAKYSAGVAKQIGPTAMSAVKQVKKIDPGKIFEVKRTTRTFTISGTNSIKLKDGSTVLYTPKSLVK